MTIKSLIKSVEVITDEQGRKKAVLDWQIWQEIQTLLEGIVNEQRWDELFAKSPDVLAQLADEARTERIRMQNEHAMKLLREWVAEPDDMGEEWWDEFEAELRQNRRTFREREMN